MIHHPSNSLLGNWSSNILLGNWSIKQSDRFHLGFDYWNQYTSTLLVIFHLHTIAANFTRATSAWIVFPTSNWTRLQKNSSQLCTMVVWHMFWSHKDRAPYLISFYTVSLVTNLVHKWECVEAWSSVSIFSLLTLNFCPTDEKDREHTSHQFCKFA